MKKQAILVLVALGILSIYAEEAGAKEKTVRILHTNDSHGRAFEGEFDGMGFAKLKTMIEENQGEHSLLLDAGDTFHGTTFATLDQGESILKTYNQIGYDALVPGNHDFNYGLDRLQELAEMANFPVIGANVLDASGDPLFEPYILREVNGVTLGIFGLSTPETAYKTHPDNVKEVVFDDPSVTAARMVKELEEEDVDVIIGLSHLGIDESSVDTSEKVAAEVQGIDVIIDGHSHSILTHGVEAGNETLIASAGEYVQNLGIVELTFEEDELVEKKAWLMNQEDAGEPDEEVESLLTDMEANQQELLAEVVGKTAIKLNGEREHVRVEETNLGNLIADVLREATDADIALTNGGGIRASIAPGQITKGDLVSVSPFGNFGVTKEVTGAQLIELLENGVKAYPEPSGGFPQISGFTFAFNPDAPSGSRVHSVEIAGEPITEDTTYVLATNDFLAAGGDEYNQLAEAPLVNEFNAIDELLMNYLQSAGEIAPEVTGRMIVDEGIEPGGNSESALYIIQPGDTLFEIGLNHNLLWTTLMELNPHLYDSDLIYAGATIKIQ
ncbi:5'-nucleotidase C-terminal domain-containing protein [Shouchella patagoniensis]|uniref:5'-nucleotidase C-terminal domain-containing protein n=1 Tax=Shouchella patagoniensis TaxID=228576 RepID=UPI0009957521|nr:5'-nucleotidase C-terminal domain-containing protein [Shouchella patagoniensis]